MARRTDQRARVREIPPTAGLPPRWRDLLPPFSSDLAARAARFLGVPQVQIECSGTAALIVALTTLHRLSGRRFVVVPAYTCPLVALAVAYCGLELRLCDLAVDGIDFDEDDLERVCNDRTLAIVPTHLGGRAIDITTSLRIARSVGAYVIEDAAQGLGARQDGVSVGLAGDIGFFSLAAGKGLTTYEGGLLISRDETLRRELARTSVGIVPRKIGWELKRSLQLFGYHIAYRPILLPLAYGLPLRRALRRGDAVAAVGDDFPAKIPVHKLGAWRRSVGARALARLPGFLDAGRVRAANRVAQIEKIAGIKVIGDAANGDGVWPFLLVRMPSRAARDHALTILWRAGVGVSRLFIHALPDYLDLSNIVAPADVPNARAFAERSLTISNSEWLGDDVFAWIAAVLESVIS
ncbi:MAG: DegT/DnrJ/EryC1/StrS family aminotransferase [Dokdonella sp.]